MESQIDRARGALLGLACGDALGRPVEFKSSRTIERLHGRVTDMLADGTHGQPAGTVTDDTDLAMCIARSLVECREFDGADIADRFVEWYESGPFDIGIMTSDAITEYRDGAAWDEAGRRVWERRSEGANAGNGSIMRCAPHALAFVDARAERLVQVSRHSSAITHFDPRCRYGCALLNLTLAGFIRGDEAPLEAALGHIGTDAPAELVESIDAVPDEVDSDDLQSTGYVIHTLQTALHDALAAETAEDAVVTAVNRGGDTDTVGAVTGTLAGARFGASGLPSRWLERLDVRSQLEDLADALVNHEIAPPELRR